VNTNLPAWVTILCSSLSGGIFGAIVAFFLVLRKEKNSRQRTFRGYIKSVKAELKAIDLKARTGGDELLGTYKATVSGVRRACCDVSDDIPRPEFQDCWEGYCGLTEADIVQREPFKNGKGLEEQLYECAASHYDRGREKMFAHLDALIRHAE